MKLFNIYIPLVMTFVLTACSQDEPLMDTNTAGLLTISVTDSGFQTESRSVENGYTTQFTDGDKCGLYIVNNGIIVVDNLKITASVAEDGNLTWVTDNSAGIRGGINGEQYYLYYPYTENITDKVDASATSVNDFFANLIADWTPNNNQSDYATGYSASDLMVGAGTINGTQLSFSMKHCMGLLRIQVPKVTYVFTDNAIPDFTTPAVVDFSNSSVTPFRMNDGTYHLIWNYRQGNPTIVGRYLNDKKEFTISPGNLRPGCCMALTVHDESEQGKTMEYALAVGDYFCKDDSNNWYVIPHEAGPDGNAIGVVFYAGLHSADSRSSYDIALVDGGPKLPEGVFHGYVVALTDVNNGRDDRVAWLYGPNKEYQLYLGTSTSETDWKGYQNCYKVMTYVNNRNGWEMKHVPAVLACLTYGSRSVDQNGNPSDAYAWQEPLSAPNNSSGWFLPSVGQLAYLANNQTLLSECMDNIKNHTNPDKDYYNHIQWFDKKLFYWSSTERAGDNNMFTRVMDFKYGMQSSSKDLTKPTRPVLAF